MVKERLRDDHHSSPIVELRSVCKRYPSEKRRALVDVDLAVYPNEFLAILGPSGAGKTTLLHMLGLLDRPSEGQVLVMGELADSLEEQERADLRSRFLGFVFQFHFLLPDLTVWENVLLPLLITDKASRVSVLSLRHGGDRWSRSVLMERRVAGMLSAVGLDDKAHRLPEELSGGERQRVAVARALVTNPPLILADEPTGNLDTGNASLVWDLLVKANKEQGTAVVAITHNEELAKGAQRVIHIVDGEIVAGK